jgi:hypothetical protein
MDLTISGPDGDARIRSLIGESMFIASLVLVLVLPTVLARTAANRIPISARSSSCPTATASTCTSSARVHP